MPSATPALPVFDFSKFLHGDRKEKSEAAADIVDAFKNLGFVYLTNYGISEDKIQSLFDWVCYGISNREILTLT